jgi:hypothetical protein
MGRYGQRERAWKRGSVWEPKPAQWVYQGSQEPKKRGGRAGIVGRACGGADRRVRAVGARVEVGERAGAQTGAAGAPGQPGT